MTNKLKALACSFWMVLAWSLPAQSATVTVVPDSSSVLEGGSFTVALVLNAADTGGSMPGSHSGSVVIDFDPALVMFNGFNFIGPASLLTPPGLSSDSGAGTVTLGFEFAPAISVIGYYEFSVIGAANSLVNFGLADGDDFFGSFSYQEPTNTPYAPEFFGTAVTIQAVPLPATIWLLLGGLGLWSAIIRRAR